MFRRHKTAASVLLVFSIIMSCFLVTTSHAQNAEENVSINIKKADIRDVLSAVAVSMNKKIIFSGEPMEIDFSIQDVTAKEALEYLLKQVGLEYIEDGNTLIIGSRDDLSNYFYNKITLTRFNLKYITSDVLSAQLSVLGIPVRKITLESNKKAIWIYGLPQELTMVNELITMIDKPENAMAQASSPTSEQLLTPITLRYINAYQLSDILSQMGMGRGIVLDSSPMTLWVYGDNSTITRVQEIQKKVDIAENSRKTNIILSSAKLTYLTSDEVIPILYELGSDVTIVDFKRSLKTIWLYGTEDSINQAVEAIKKFDIKEHSIDNIFFTYKLTNITAKELKSRIEKLELSGVMIDYMDYPEFSKTVIVYCPSDFKAFVLNHIIKLDTMTEKIKVPVDYSTVSGGMARLTERRNLLSQLTGIPESSFTITNNVSRDDSLLYIMYLEETPENIRKVKDYITYIDNPLTDGLSD